MTGLSKKEFMMLYKAGNTKRPPQQLANWEEIIKSCKAAEKDYPFTLTEFYVNYVKGAVSKQRSRNKLEEIYAKGELLRVIDRRGAYHYAWIPETLQE